MTARLWTMPIEGTHCPDCGDRVARALRAAGARDVQVDWRAGRATFIAEESLPLERLASAVAQAGYRPGPVEAPRPAPTPQGPPAVVGARLPTTWPSSARGRRPSPRPSGPGSWARGW